jgi:hypothetical protein
MHDLDLSCILIITLYCTCTLQMSQTQTIHKHTCISTIATAASFLSSLRVPNLTAHKPLRRRKIDRSRGLNTEGAPRRRRRAAGPREQLKKEYTFPHVYRYDTIKPLDLCVFDAHTPQTQTKNRETEKMLTNMYGCIYIYIYIYI